MLKIIGFEIAHVGQPGKAPILKVVTNFLVLTHLVAIGEALMGSKKAVLVLVKPMKLWKLAQEIVLLMKLEARLFWVEVIMWIYDEHGL